MSLRQTLREKQFESRRFEYDDETEYVVDLGPSANGTVDVVDNTAIIVGDKEQYEIEIPHDAQVFMNNNVLTIEVEE
ncbi:hypothetical protein ACFQJ7_12930 [Halovenus rubra]|uniref:Hsp20/alpha crystallin family protein n=2 Tax=Halovenus rubra TaxID=869890 RepID=A0ABD5X6U0_9EURY|nr:hypothetical protein [Halovenus rubra]